MTEYQKEIENLNELIAEAKEKMNKLVKEYDDYSSEEFQEAYYGIYNAIEKKACETLDEVDTSFVIDCLWSALTDDKEYFAISKDEYDDIIETSIDNIASEIYRLWECRLNKYMWRTAVQ